MSLTAGIEKLQSACDRVRVEGRDAAVRSPKAEFGVRNMQAPQKVCHQAETTIDACTERGAWSSVDAMLEKKRGIPAGDLNPALLGAAG